MSRLAADASGNVLALSAVALIPLLAMIGGAIDASRLYMAHTRLQQACDAGALAARKAMANVKTLTTDEQNKAKQFFDFNFPDGTWAAGNRQRSFVKGSTDGVVVGSASVDMPTMVMKIFGYKTVPLTVSCESTLNIPNTDVMFVLDVTGSMNETPSGDTVNKITGLRNAVKNFYALLGPGAASGPGRIRYGFMPYSSNVNVGRILLRQNTSWVVGGVGADTRWTYQSRTPNTTPVYIPTYGTESAQSNGANTDGTITWGDGKQSPGSPYYSITESACRAKQPADTDVATSTTGAVLQTDENPPAYPDNVRDRTYKTTEQRTKTQYGVQWDKTGTSKGQAIGTCYVGYRTGTYTRTYPSSTTTPVTWEQKDKFLSWSYQARDVDLTTIVQNPDANNPNPAYFGGYSPDVDPNINYWYSGGTKSSATAATLYWSGCIEEARTIDSITSSSSLTIPSNAYDLQIDLVPSSLDTRWKPFLPQIQYDRPSGGRSYGNWIGRPNGDLNACPREASPLQQYAGDYVAASGSVAAYSPSFNAYVDTLTPGGYTYHDIGLIWGARFLSPDGIFGSTNSDASGPGGYQINRNIVFMTDGELNTQVGNSDPWGYNPLDLRVLPASAATTTRSMQSHRRRIQMICNAMKSKAFTIWVIGFGVDDLPDELKKCASDDDHWSVADNSDQLKEQFSKIAQAVGGLRLSS